MPYADFRTQSGKARGYIGSTQIRTGNFVPKVEEDFGNPAHADSADAYEVYLIDFSVHREPSWFSKLPSFHRQLSWPRPDAPG